MLFRNIWTGSLPTQVLKCSNQLSQRLFSSINIQESFTNKYILPNCTNVSLLRNSNGYNSIKYYSSVYIFPNNSLSNSLINNEEKKLLVAHKDFQQQNRGYAMRMELTEYGLLWKKPEHIPCWKPEKSGDLIPFEEPDLSLPVVSMLNVSSEIAKADEKVQQLLSLEFSNEKEVVKMAKYLMKRRIQSHKYDEDSREVKIALMTISIRHIQKVLAVNKKPVKLRVYLKELIERRKKKLKILRKYDYKKFEWLIEELEVIYKPIPRDNPKISRRGALRQLVDLHCINIKNEKLERYRLELETMKRPFLEEKRQTLKWIAETEKKLGLPVSVEVPEEDEIKQLKDGLNNQTLNGGLSNNQASDKEL